MTDIVFNIVLFFLTPVVAVAGCLAVVGFISGCVLFLLLCIGGLTGQFSGLKTERCDE